MAERKNIKLNKNTSASVKEYVELLRSDGFPVEKVILFGSRAKNLAKRDSDIDICVVSDKFGKNYHEEGKYLFRKLWEMKRRGNIEPVGYSPKDFYSKEKNSPLLHEIKRHGIELKV